MKKLSLQKVLKQSSFIANKYILDNFNDENNDIRLCGSNSGGVLLEESLETLLAESGIDLMDGNRDISILKQGDCFYKIKNLYNNEGSDGNEQHLDFSGLQLIGQQKPRKVYIETLDGVTYDCEPTVDDVVQAIIEEHERHDVIIGENLESLKIHGLTIPEVVKVYAILYSKFEEDRVIRIAEGEEIDLRYY